MYLSRTAEYALRTMACLARPAATDRVRSQDLADLTGVPGPYLSKILRRLTAAGLLTSQRGHRGGFRLAKPAPEVRFADILKAVEFEPAEDSCLFGRATCGPGDPCPLHRGWAGLKEALEEWAQGHTLADVLADDVAPTPTGQQDTQGS